MRSLTAHVLPWIALFIVSVTSAEEISFNRDVRPILSDRCFHCHGPGADNQDSEFRLDTEEHALADLGGYAGIVPGDLDRSELHRRIRSDDESEQMPPTESVRQLSDSEKDILDDWIKSGARFEQHWSFIPVRKSIAVPTVGGAWSRNSIDRFIYKQIRQRGLTPNQAASREKWLRRVTFDLTGLPPTLTELDAFLADDSDEACETVVDRLLDTDAYAERMASEWLDVARYSDSYGYQTDGDRYAWPYRDWVIRAFRQNMRFDDFITWQLAGDLIPDASREQRLATAFNRLHSHKKEGGSSPEEFRIEYVADRLHTLSTAFMGLTFECARCHDHKYDPIKTKDYYRLSSFFSNIDEYGIISFFTDAVPTPAMSLPSTEQEVALAAASSKVKDAETALQQSRSETKSDFETWLNKQNSGVDAGNRLNPKAPEPLSGLTAHFAFESFDERLASDTGEEPAETERRLASSFGDSAAAKTNSQNKIVAGKIGNAIWLTGDDAVDIPEVGRFSREQPFSFSLWIKTAEVTERAVIFRRSRGWDDAGSIGYELTKVGSRLSARMCHFWPGNAIGIESEEILRPGEWFHVAVTYDGSSKAAGLRLFVNGKPASTKIDQDQLTRQITQWRGGYEDLAIGSRYRDRGFKHGLVDEFQVYDRTLSRIEVAHLFDGESLNDALSTPLEQLTGNNRDLLYEYYLLSISGPMAAARDQLQAARKEWNAAMDATPAIAIMRESQTGVPNFVLVRGAYDNPSDSVSADTPDFLPPFPEGAPRDRLGLARWLTASNHPLTARVTVNRYWQLMFGDGLVRTPEDFGRQGQPPTHPELLDWLARDFMDSGWNLHQLIRKMALSATYRQSAVVTSVLRDRDPENLWLACGTSQRLSAEMIRDNALAVSGLLVKKLGGPPVRPYDLSLSFKPSRPDTGNGLYRRSLYTFWRRTAPTPVMMTMNANKRDVCRVRREVTASPLQALVLLNSPQFVEASRVVAGKLLQKHDKEKDIDLLIEDAFRLLTSRKPGIVELNVLRALFDEQYEAYNSNPARARALLQTGQSAVTLDGVSEATHAAATILVNAIMNLDECVRHK